MTAHTVRTVLLWQRIRPADGIRVTVTTTLEGLTMTDMPGRDPDVLTTAELATKLGLSPQTVRRMANARQIPALKTGKDFRYSWEAVREVLRRPHHQPGDVVDDPRDTEAFKKGAGYRAQRWAWSGASDPITNSGGN